MAEDVTPTTKPGYKTTEFWLATVATLCGLAFASGALADETSLVFKIVSLVASVLTSLGYAVVRSKAKAEAK